jgi:hypothetical protein
MGTSPGSFLPQKPCILHLVQHIFCLDFIDSEKLLAVKGGRNLDIFIMKLIANRPRDIEDCVSLASAKMDFEVIYSEILAQYTKAGTVEEKIWITYLEVGIGKLEEDYRPQVTIADRVSELANEYRERLYQKLKPR